MKVGAVLSDDLPTFVVDVSATGQTNLRTQTTPWSIMASATFTKPAILAPIT